MQIWVLGVSKQLFTCQGSAGDEVHWNLCLAPTGPLETFFTAIITELLLPSANTSFNTHRTLVISRDKAQLQLGNKFANCNSTSSLAILKSKGLTWHWNSFTCR